MEVDDISFYNDEVMTGTTLVALKCRDGLILAADSRTSMGNMVVSRSARKITRITDKIFICRSGSASDTQTIVQYVRKLTADHELELGEEARVKSVASLARIICYQNKEYLTAGLIVAGVDPYDGFKIFQIALGGSMIEKSYALSGSGSAYIYSLLDATYHTNMDIDECKDFARRLVSHAIFRDSSSGGLIRMVIITKEGYQELVIPGEELPNL
ncbi:proteasome subunit beta type 6 precursor, putative [Cryptosporidium muris RN66]|uniref:Proteasome subunit beta n=1 Tax=Cryptosporidium muris (strain RN66) TaxID=441375 RepID=B6AE19_CRYMR|nr:proteasome subunit beta type 6 precursor, putative [Cryptosporidium muris RN66]EEA06460.1 proteasome subunit beta type 6 precursor, putative [Cryptosporidium muris RN66]|eukprot:XP_002140809.1 proteasome subunit beta type 6 precursor [Cryptosporidium muris RN66]